MRRFLLTSVIAIALAMAAGCEGGDVAPPDDGPEQGDIGSGVPIDPFFVSGPDCEADPGAAGCDVAPVVERDCTRDPTAAGCKKFRADRIDIRTEKKLPDGKVGESYEEVRIEADGAGPFSFQAEGLPPGLSIDKASGVISGTPTGLGKSRPAITVTDSKGTEEEKKFSLTIKGAIDLKVFEMTQGSWTELKDDAPSNWWIRPYKLEVVGEDDEYTWEVKSHDSEIVCFTSVEPSKAGFDRSSCADDSSQNSKVMYLYLKENQPDADPLTVTVEVEGEFSDPRSLERSFRFDYPMTPPETPSQPRQAVKAVVDRIRVSIKTAGGVDDAGTDGDVVVSFCNNKKRNCLNYTMNPPGNNFEEGDVDPMIFPNINQPKDELKYIKIKLDGGGGWLLQGLKVEYFIDNKWELYFRNPGINKWLYSGDTLTLSPNDTAVIAVFKTSCEENEDAGTIGTPLLVFPKAKKGTRNEMEEKYCSDHDAPCFFIDDGNWVMRLEYNGDSDFGQCEADSYGAYFFDSNPFTDGDGNPVDRLAFEIKMDDTDGWDLKWMRLSVFHPGQIEKNTDVNIHSEYVYTDAYMIKYNVNRTLESSEDGGTPIWKPKDGGPRRRNVGVADTFDIGGYHGE